MLSLGLAAGLVVIFEGRPSVSLVAGASLG
jgi:hypothetical protein